MFKPGDKVYQLMIYPSGKLEISCGVISGIPRISDGIVELDDKYSALVDDLHFTPDAAWDEYVGRFRRRAAEAQSILERIKAMPMPPVVEG